MYVEIVWSYGNRQLSRGSSVRATIAVGLAARASSIAINRLGETSLGGQA